MPNVRTLIIIVLCLSVGLCLALAALVLCLSHHEERWKVGSSDQPISPIESVVPVADAAKTKAEAAAKTPLATHSGFDNENEMAELTRLISQKVQRSWIRPPTTEGKQWCLLEVRLDSDGTVQEIDIISSSGDEAFDRSALNAVSRASPLPVPQDKNLFAKNFQPLKFKFSPG